MAVLSEASVQLALTIRGRAVSYLERGMTKSMFYHYTNNRCAKSIIKQGVIEAHEMTLHRDMFARDRGLDIGKAVWFTTDSTIEGTILAKMSMCYGYETMSQMIGTLCRFIIPDEYPVMNLVDYAKSQKIDMEWWYWCIESAKTARSFAADWRIADHDVPLSACISAQCLSVDSQGLPVWGPEMWSPGLSESRKIARKTRKRPNIKAKSANNSK